MTSAPINQQSTGSRLSRSYPVFVALISTWTVYGIVLVMWLRKMNNADDIEYRTNLQTELVLITGLTVIHSVIMIAGLIMYFVFSNRADGR